MYPPPSSFSSAFALLFVAVAALAGGCTTDPVSTSGSLPSASGEDRSGDGGTAAACAPSRFTASSLPDGVCAEASFGLFYFESDAEFYVAASALCTKDPTALRGLMHFRIKNFASLKPGRYPVGAASGGVGHGTAYSVGDGKCLATDELVSGEVVIAKPGDAPHISAQWRSGKTLELDLVADADACSEARPDLLKTALACPVF